MISKMALKLSGALAGRGIIDSEDIVVYSYGLELLISTAISILLVIIISFVFLQPFSWIFFLLAFIPLRVTAGGYHAKTHLGCFVTFASSYAVLLLTAILTAAFVTPFVLIGVSAACFVTDLLLSPVGSSSKPLDEAQKRQNRRKSLILAAANLLVTSVSLFAGPEFLMFFSFLVLGQLGAAVLLLVAKIWPE